MGRGLSGLQQDIIIMAHKNKEAGAASYNDRHGPVITAHVKREQILRERFGWIPTEDRRLLTGNFSKKAVGAKRYGSVMASLSRALRRLERRGLVEFTHSMLAGGWGGAELTEEGEAEARRILDKGNRIQDKEPP